MLKWLIGRRLDAFARDNHYDVDYARAILDADPGALLKFNKIMGMARYRKGLPRDVWYAAKITSAMAEDCGPCTQLNVVWAEREGVAPDVLHAILDRDFDAMTPEVALACRFALAVLAREPEADALREEVVGRWGSRGLVSLAFAITVAGVFPTVKAALGYAQSCTRVAVGGVPHRVA